MITTNLEVSRVINLASKVSEGSLMYYQVRHTIPVPSTTQSGFDDPKQ